MGREDAAGDVVKLPVSSSPECPQFLWRLARCWSPAGSEARIWATLLADARRQRPVSFVARNVPNFFGGLRTLVPGGSEAELGTLLETWSSDLFRRRPQCPQFLSGAASDA